MGWPPRKRPSLHGEAEGPRGRAKKIATECPAAMRAGRAPTSNGGVAANTCVAISVEEMEKTARKMCKGHSRRCAGRAGGSHAEECGGSAKYILLLRHKQEGCRTRLPGDRTTPNLSLQCALAELRDGMLHQEKNGRKIGLDDARFVGMVPEQMATHYLTSSQPDAPADTYAKEGIAVITPNGAMKNEISLINTGVKSCISNGKLKGKDIETLHNHKGENGLEDRDEERRWASLFNVDKASVDEGRRHKWRKEQIEWRTTQLGDAVAKIIFPDMYYAKEAYNLAETYLHGGPQTVTDAEGKTLYAGVPSASAKKEIRTMPIVVPKKANILVRGKGLDCCQDMHADSEDFKLNTIHAMHCGDDGYNFRAIRKSNDLLGNPNVISELNVPTGQIEDLRVNENDIIVFAASTLHSGGRTSGWKTYKEGFERVAFGLLPKVPKAPKEEGEGPEMDFFRGYFGQSKKPRLLSDLTVQCSFELTALPATKDFGLDEPIWVNWEGEGEGSSDNEEAFLSRVGAKEGAYGKELERGAEQWLKMLAENKAPKVSRRG